MTRPSLLRSGVLRLVMIATAFFVVGAILDVAFVHYAVLRYARAAITEQVRNEVAASQAEDARRGRAALLQRLQGQREVFFALTDASGARRAGDLPAAADHVGWGTVAIPAPALRRATGAKDETEDEPFEVITCGVRLVDGSLLVVGRGLYAVDELVEGLDRTALWTACGLVGIALGLGGWIAAAFLRRLGHLNAAIRRIMDGAYQERLPAIGMGAEFERLTDQLNAMLDRILSLMEGHRQMSTNVAHDLRLPLTRVAQNLERARAADLDPKARTAVEAASDQVEDLQTTFAAILRLGTIETGAQRAGFRTVDLTALLGDLAATFAPVAEDLGKAISTRLSPGVAVSGDPDLLMQLFTNLVENALVHTGEGKLVSIEAARVGSDAVVEVVDDGPGVPKPEHDKVFQRFYRLDASRTTPGSGLGLALVKAIATLHGAEVTIADAAPGLRVRFVCMAAS